MPQFFGKPYQDTYSDALSQLDGIARDRIRMVGDTLQTDILGGSVTDVRAGLVKGGGLFAGACIREFPETSGSVPDFERGRI